MNGWRFTSWWRVVGLEDGPHGIPELWCETSDEGEARIAFTKCPYPCEFQRLQKRSDQRWVKIA